MAPMASEVSVTPSCIAAMKCGGSLVIVITARAGPVPLVDELLEPGSAHGDERVLGRDEEAVQEDQNGNAEKLEENRHAPVSGAAVLEGSSSTTARQYRRRWRRLPSAAARDARPCRRRTSRSRWESVSATANRRAAGRRSSPKSGNDTSYPVRGSVPSAPAAHAQPLGVMGDQLVGPADRVGDGVAVAAVGDRRERARSSAAARRGSPRAGRAGSPARARPSA